MLGRVLSWGEEESFSPPAGICAHPVPSSVLTCCYHQQKKQQIIGTGVSNTLHRIRFTNCCSGALRSTGAAYNLGWGSEGRAGARAEQTEVKKDLKAKARECWTFLQMPETFICRIKTKSTSVAWRNEPLAKKGCCRLNANLFVTIPFGPPTPNSRIFFKKSLIQTTLPPVFGSGRVSPTGSKSNLEGKKPQTAEGMRGGSVCVFFLSKKWSEKKSSRGRCKNIKKIQIRTNRQVDN